eukprot:gene9653-biopygen10756
MLGLRLPWDLSCPWLDCWTPYCTVGASAPGLHVHTGILQRTTINPRSRVENSNWHCAGTLVLACSAAPTGSSRITSRVCQERSVQRSRGRRGGELRTRDPLQDEYNPLTKTTVPEGSETRPDTIGVSLGCFPRFPAACGRFEPADRFFSRFGASSTRSLAFAPRSEPRGRAPGAQTIW